MVMSGDICPNRGPENAIFARKQLLATIELCVVILQCKGQNHINCANIKPSEYKRRQQSINASWSCPECTFKSLQTELPFYDEVDNATLDMNKLQQT